MPALNYRLHREEDIPGILRLWEEDSGWGRLTLEQWRQWYVDTPHGPCVVAVGVDDDDTVRAQGVMTPASLSVRGRESGAMRVSAPILQKDLRGIPTKHPVTSLFETVCAKAREDKCDLVYAFPDISLKTFLQRYLVQLKLELVPCVSIQSAQPAPRTSDGLSVAPVSQFGSEYQTLWEECRGEFPFDIAVVRSPKWLTYRYGGKLALAARFSSQELAGYAVFDEKTGLLLDCLARNRGDLNKVLKSSLVWLSRHAANIPEVKAMLTPVMRPTLDELGFQKIEYQFLFGRTLLNERLTLDSFDLTKWHFMPGD